MCGLFVGAWYPVAVHIFLRNTLCTLRLGGYCVLSLLLLCERCKNGVNYTLMSNAGCVAASQNIWWTIVQCVLKWSVDKARESYVLANMCSDFVDTNLLRI